MRRHRSERDPRLGGPPRRYCAFRLRTWQRSNGSACRHSGPAAPGPGLRTPAIGYGHTAVGPLRLAPVVTPPQERSGHEFS